MANNDTIQKTITVAVALCIVCSIVVSSAAVMLRPAQEANKALDFKRNVLAAANILQEGVGVEEQFSKVQSKIVELESGTFSDAFEVETFEQRALEKDSANSDALGRDKDIAKIGRLEKFAKVYIAADENGEKVLILPVRGYGLWSTLRGFIALKGDLNTVVGLGFYEHKETPGLGGEVENPRWLASIAGKQVFDDSGEVVLRLIKGSVLASTPDAQHKIDGLSGATLTSNGVTNLIKFWLGESGFGPFLTNYKNGSA